MRLTAYWPRVTGRAATLARRTATATATATVSALVLATFGLAGAPASANARTFTAVSGSGSSWASIAIDQWSSNIRSRGIVVNYNPDGSQVGRVEFINNQDDFASSDVPFRNGRDELAGTAREVVPWSYSYIPAVAGGVAFPYHIKVGGQLIHNLRLSGKTLMDIFTGRIINWDDPRITRDYGSQLPNLPITPVIRADYAGPTYYFTRWMAHVFPSQWNAFCERVHPGIKLPCPQTELYPRFGNARAENGSSNVVTYITSSGANGAIGYDEYAYTLNARVPVVKVGNPGGNYVRPRAAHVDTALTRATVVTNPKSPRYLQVNLDRVYTDKNPGSYPLSYTGYMIVPRTPKPPPIFTHPAGKGRSLSAFIAYAVCAGQSHLALLGYAPLPPNLVKDGLQQAGHIPGHGPIPARCP